MATSRHDKGDEPAASLEPAKRPPWWQFHHLALAALLILGTGGIVAICSFIGVVWREAFRAAFGGQVPELWKDAALSSGLVRVVTLFSIILRLIVALQAGVITTMAASLILERGKVPAIHAPALSMSRFLSDCDASA